MKTDTKVGYVICKGNSKTLLFKGYAPSSTPARFKPEWTNMETSELRKVAIYRTKAEALEQAKALERLVKKGLKVEVRPLILGQPE